MMAPDSELEAAKLVIFAMGITTLLKVLGIDLMDTVAALLDHCRKKMFCKIPAEK